MEIRWQKQYEIGNFEIDAEHKVFVQIIQKIAHAGQAEKSIAYLDRLMLELLKYAEFHFCSEENIMIDTGYPDLKDHQQKHRELLMELRGLIPEAENRHRKMDEILAFYWTDFISIRRLKISISPITSVTIFPFPPFNTVKNFSRLPPQGL